MRAALRPASFGGVTPHRQDSGNRPPVEESRLAAPVACGLLGLLAGVVADIAWLGWSGWGVLGGAALGTLVGVGLGRVGRS